MTALFGPRRAELRPVAWSFLYFFCVLSAYYILRPVREAMAVGSGAGTIPMLFTGTFFAMLIATSVFGWVASRFPRRTFLPWVYLFFIANILVFWAVFDAAVDGGREFVWLGRVFFVWLSVFNLFVVSVFWSFMADIWDREQGRRLFGLISAGGSIGALIGGAVTSLIVADFGFANLFPISAALLAVAVLCIQQLKHWVENEHVDDVEDSAASHEPLGGKALSGFSHVLQSPYFRAIAINSVIASLLGTALYMFAAELVEQAIPDTDSRTRFFSNINVIQNALALVGQLLVVKYVVRRFGVGVSLSLMPIASVVGFALLAIDPVLAVVAFLTVTRRALGFAFSKPSTDMLYSVVEPEDKYKVKNFIDTAVYRGGDLVGTWTIQLLKSVAGLGITGVSILMVPFAIAWASLALWLGRDYRRRAGMADGHATESTDD
ncbi:MAG: MFS transporter [Woeseiaceae bacterium]|jgi:AAA family ATP:ADP antiporter|nr:MFS transporter [Woeseiaceae bacterium]